MGSTNILARESGGTALRSMRVEESLSVVTGAGSGLGRTFALALAAAGSDVVLTELPGKEDAAAEVAGLIRTGGRRAYTAALDVTDVAMIESTLHAIERDMGTIDVRVNNAGITIPQPCL